MLRTAFSRSFLHQHGSITKLNSKSAFPSITQTASAHVDPIGKSQKDRKDFWIKNETQRRPMSPHLTIWKWQLPMLTSLGHRISGSAMTTTLYCFAYGITVLPGDYASYLNVIASWDLGPAVILGAKFILAFPLAYHFINGFRHLSWDMGLGFELSTIYKTGWVALIGGAILAACLTQL